MAKAVAKPKMPEPPSGVLSTAEAISLFGNSMDLADHFGSGQVDDSDLAAGLHCVVIKEGERDATAWVEYPHRAFSPHVWGERAR